MNKGRITPCMAVDTAIANIQHLTAIQETGHQGRRKRPAF